MSSPLLCLRWNNHHPNLTSLFKNLLEDEELVDVTISVEGQKIKAHKVILSACSPYFKQLFSTNSCKHPVLILGDVKFLDLKTIIEFMYCGEINITDERLPDILEVAGMLQVRGLFHPNKKEKENQESPMKAKKDEVTIENVMHQNDDEQKQKLAGSSNVNLSVPTDEGTSAMNWMNEQSNEIELNTEYLPLIQGSLLLPNVSYEREFAWTDRLPDPPSPPTNHPATPAVRRRNTKVQQSENFHLALEAVRTGQLGFCKAAKLYGLNNRTLWLEYKKRGYPTKRSQPLGLRLKQASSY